MLTTIFIIASTVTLLFVVYSYWFQNYSWVFKNVKKIPGPAGYPIVGNMLSFMVPQEKFFLHDRNTAFKYFPIYKETLMNIAFVTIMLPEDVELVLSSMVHLKKGFIYDLIQPWLGTGLLTSEGSKWQSRRKILTPAFHFNILQGFVNIFNEETSKLVRNLEKQVNQPHIDVVPVITELTLHAIVETAMGTKLNSKDDDNKTYRQAVYDFGKVLVYRIGRPWLFSPQLFKFTRTGRVFDKMIDVLHKFSESVIVKRKKSFDTSISYASGKRLAMLDLLLTAQANGANIDDDGIREEVDTFIFEGHDTTSVALCYILMLLANYRKFQDEVYEEIIDVLGDTDKHPTQTELQQLPFLERFLKECLRLYPSVPEIDREVSQDIHTKSGYLIPKGAIAVLRIHSIHHSPFLYSDPEKFDPDRFLPENTKTRHPFAYIPFSAGPRNCIGQKFAMLELKAVVCGILRKFVLEPVTKPEELVFITDLVLRTQGGIKVKFVKRNQ